jgi:hypothetical protein
LIAIFGSSRAKRVVEKPRSATLRNEFDSKNHQTIGRYSPLKCLSMDPICAQIGSRLPALDQGKVGFTVLYSPIYIVVDTTCFILLNISIAKRAINKRRPPACSAARNLPESIIKSIENNGSLSKVPPGHAPETYFRPPRVNQQRYGKTDSTSVILA